MKSKPPKILEFFLKVTTKTEYGFGALGDFEEIYKKKSSKRGVFYALVWYISQIFKSVPFLIKTKLYWSAAMFKNHFKIAFRNMKRQKLYSIINISGLAIGLASCILILVWIQNELSYDRFHKNFDNIFKIVCKGKIILNDYDGTPGVMGPALKEEVPDVKDFARIFRTEKNVFKYKDKVFYETGGVFVDPSFFKIFTFPFEKGDPESALSNTGNIVITREMADKYFGDEDPIGKTIEVERDLCTISGVLKNIPVNSHIKFDYAVSFQILERAIGYSWSGYNYVTFLYLNDNAEYKGLGSIITETARKNNSWQVINRGVSFVLEPLSKIHLHDKNDFHNWTDIGDIKYIYIFSITAFFILFIACANYVNLSSARSASRAGEIGMRKVLGAFRGQIIKQFFGESFLSVITASVMAVLTAYAVLPFFSRIAGKEQILNMINFKFAVSLLGIIILTGLLAGIYPGVILSSFEPVNTLKQNFKSGKKHKIFRSFLVTAQFSFSIILLISTAVIFSQLNFIKNRNLGFDKDGIICVPLKGNIGSQYEAFKNELENSPMIAGVTVQNYSFAKTQRWGTTTQWEGNNGQQRQSFIYNLVDYNFFELLNIKFSEGRGFSKNIKTDGTQAFVINETAVKEMGMENPVGKQFYFGFNSSNQRTGTIIGIMEDTHFKSLKSEIAPHLFAVLNDKAGATYLGEVLIKINASGNGGKEKFNPALNHVRKAWEKFNPEAPFEFEFMDDAYNAFYFEENRTSVIINYFTFLALFVSVLGLFGLASFTVEARTKELGIRKVIGASVPSLIVLVSREFIKVVIAASIIAIPVGYYIMNKWLQNFAYRTEMHMWIFAGTTVFALITALLTVSFQTIRAAMTNPVDSLRNE